ncbi:hypothetical protein LCGC14_0369540 [marine sediment metagenome]|uniref:Uncharacterized protein n=1 Tax=marine sediment metagenome TaxID=412755 RepID=A0A0F9T5F0_9ZZZZ
MDFFFPNMTPQQVNKAYPQLLPAIKAAKAKARKINEGKDNEEMTVKAVYYECRHDEVGSNKPDGPRTEI